MKRKVAILLALLAATTALVSAGCDTDTPVPPTPPVATPTVNPTAATAETTRVQAPTPTRSEAVWQLFSSAAGRFSVQMPGKPAEGTKPMQDALGNLTLNSFAVEDEGTAFTLFYVDFPDSVQKANPSDLLNAALTRVEGKNTITDQKNIDVQGNPGVEVEGQNGDKGYMRYKAVLAKTRLYELIVLTPNKDTSVQDAARFLDSFKLTSQ